MTDLELEIKNTVISLNNDTYSNDTTPRDLGARYIRLANAYITLKPLNRKTKIEKLGEAWEQIKKSKYLK
jgi:hypothetical protein